MMKFSTKFYIILALLMGYAGFIWWNAMQTLVVHGDDYRSKVKDMKSTYMDIEPVRGFIFAQGGELLAGSLPEYDVYLDFHSTTVPDKRGFMNIPRDTILRYFAPDGLGTKALVNAYTLPEMNIKSAEEFSRNVMQAYNARKGHYLLLRALPYLDYKRLRQQPYFNKIRYRNGISIEERAHRYRPYGAKRMASSTIGNVYTMNGKDSTQVAGHGRQGLEKGYDEWLAGKMGRGYTQKVRRRVTTITTQQPENGANVHTTLDVEMQEILDRELSNRILELNSTEGWAAFMEVKTGKIVAISNMKREGDHCVEDYNHLFSDLGAPGSTFKTVSYMVLLENGKITPETKVNTNNTRDHPSEFYYNGKWIRDDHPVGEVTADEAMVQSSNIALAKLTTQAYEKDPKAYLDAINKIGFLDDHVLSDEEKELLQKQNILPLQHFNQEFPGALSARHRRHRDGNWSGMSLGQISYGYETDIPGIFMLQFYNAIANGGKLVRPYLVDYVEKDSKVLFRQKTEVLNPKICSDKTLQAVRHALEGVIDHGTAAGQYRQDGSVVREGARSLKLSIAGKTGTAQRLNPETGLYTGNGHNVSFVGYFPADEPEYCGIVVINSKGYKGGKPGGGFMAGPVFKHFAEQVYAMHCRRKLKELPVDTIDHKPQVKRGLQNETNYVIDKLDLKVDNDALSFIDLPAAPTSQMPDVKGMGASDALLMLESAGYHHVKIVGYGKVVSQTGDHSQVTLTLTQ